METMALIGNRTSLSFGSRKYGQPPSPWHNHMLEPTSPTKAKWQLNGKPYQALIEPMKVYTITYFHLAMTSGKAFMAS
jgi:hypothetical protein